MIDKIRKIKYARMKPEERFVYDIVTNLEEYYDPSDINKKYYKHNNELLFDYNLENDNFGCHYYKFWSVLESKFIIEYYQIRSLVKRIVEEHLIKKDIILGLQSGIMRYKVEEYLIRKNITVEK